MASSSSQIVRVQGSSFLFPFMGAAFVELDTGSSLKITVVDATTGKALDITGMTIQLVYQIDNGSKITRSMTIVDPVNGIAAYKFLDNELTSGTMTAEIVVTDTTGKVLTSLDLIGLIIRQKLTTGAVQAAPTGAQSANTVYAGPTSGPVAVPVFRSLLPADTAGFVGPTIGVDQIGPASGGDESGVTVSRASHGHRIPFASEAKWLTD